MAAVLINQEEKITLLQAAVTEKANCTGQTVNLLIQAEPKTIEAIPEKIEIGEEVLIVFLEGLKGRCFLCGQLGHIRKNCKERKRRKKKKRKKMKRKKKKKKKRRKQRTKEKYNQQLNRERRLLQTNDQKRLPEEKKRKKA
uniref:CCHC-type domain-containing protein n=1 Tax=Octopus bimaculoides TaxID=37653 RepID=A0A0L8GWT5_OCTBM